ncbi:MAG: hypothetical protein IPJ02_18005 [Chitinophagaceae bacterium]|nr:hypothetical protein [Chitinophagaceae bacterium]
MDFSKTKLICTQLGTIMSEPKGALTDKMFTRLEYLKSRPELTEIMNLERIELQFRMDNYDPTALSKGCMNYLMFIYQYLKYGKQVYHIRKSKRQVTAMNRGSTMEKTSFEIIKRVTGQNLFRHKTHLSNDFLKGQLDVIDGQTLKKAKKIIDVKTSYSQFDFMKCVNSDVVRSYNFQMHGYFAITGKEYGEVYHVLPDFTEDVIQENKDKMMELLCPDGVITDEFMEEWQYAEDNMRFSHIPDEDRIIMYPIERDEKIIGKIYEKVEFCRGWLAKFEEKHLAKIAAQLEQWRKK